MNAKESIQRLTNAYGVVGDMREVGELARTLLSPYMDAVEIDSLGNVIGRKACGIPGASKLLLEAHIDQPGFLVTQVADNGFLRFMEMGIDRWPMPSSALCIKTRSGARYSAFVAAAPTCAPNETLPITELVADTGMCDADAKGIFHVGDYMTYADETTELQKGILCSSAADGRVGFVAILHALELLSEKPLPVDLIVLGGANRESGRDIAWREKPDYAVSAGVCHGATADSGGKTAATAGKGPVILIGSNSLPCMARKMETLAQENRIPHQMMAAGGNTNTGAWHIQTAGNGVATLAVAVPVKYSHSPAEVFHVQDVEHLGALIAAFTASLEGGCAQ